MGHQAGAAQGKAGSDAVAGAGRAWRIDAPRAVTAALP
jgi:hypothetical protein